MIEKIISLFHLDVGDRKKNYGFFEGIFSIVVNLLLFAIKFIFGTMLNSVSLLADALHSLSDVISSAIIIFGFRISAKPADSKHPFGHGRAERIVSIVLACMLIVVGFEFFINGFNRFTNPVPIKVNVLVIAVLIISIFAKEFLYKLALSFAKRIDSPSLKADAWHHRTDAISTVLVVIGFVAFKFGLFYLDGILGMLISCSIIYTGIYIIVESGSSLMGEAPSSSLVNTIEEIASGCTDVQDVHHIHVHDYGGKFEITVHIRLKRSMHLDEVHRRASEVERAIKKIVPGAEVTVHTEPEYKNIG